MNKRIPILIGLILLALAVWVQTTSVDVVRQLIIRLDNVGYDLELRAKVFTHYKKPDSPVVIIDIDDKSLQKEGRWPWPRAKMANLISRLKEEGIVVVAMDIMFSEQESDIADTLMQELDKDKLNTPAFTTVLKQIQPQLNNDNKFAAVLAQQDSVLGMTFLPRNETSGQLPIAVMDLKTPQEKALDFIEADGYIGNIPILQTAAKYAGFINVYPDPDGVIRRVPLLMRYGDKLYPSLALAAVKLFLLENISLSAGEYNNTLQLESVKVGNHTIPTDALSQMLVPFRGRSFTFPYISATSVLNKTVVPHTLEGKIAFIGTSATGLGDLRAAAIQPVYPGVEIQATIADGILTDNYSYKPEWTKGAEISVTLGLGLIFSLLFPFLGPRSLTLFAFVVPVCLVFLNNWLWVKTGLIIFILIPILLTILLAIINMVYGYVFETRKREHLKEMFGQYVPEEHIDEMLKTSGSYAMMGEDRDMTVLFADIRNFTSISEMMTASELKEFLNQIFTPLTEIIFRHEGTIDKYIGDLIMAFWGAPLRDKNHAEHAIAAALDMQTAAHKLRSEFVERGWAEPYIGIGINSGEMSVGDMGSKFRRNYTVLGDAVNLASRVEGLTKYYGVHIITTESTITDQKRFVFRLLDRVRVKGKKLSIAIYEIVNRKKKISPEHQKEIDLSNLALSYYFKQEWDAAEKTLSALHAAHPDVKLYHLYLMRIAEFKQNPPPADWDGVYAHASK